MLTHEAIALYQVHSNAQYPMRQWLITPCPGNYQYPMSQMIITPCLGNAQYLTR